MANPRTELILKKCGKGHVQNMPKYYENYSKVLQSMQREMQKKKSATGEEGNVPNRVYVLPQCMNDLSTEDCHTCFSKINTLLPGCFPSASGRVFFDGCCIRVDNYSFFHESTSSDDTSRCSDSQDGSKQFLSMAHIVIDKLVHKALDNKGYTVWHATSYGIPVYGMENCWEMLESSSCASCLEDAKKSLIRCLPAVEAHSLNAGCFLRYSDYDFINKEGLLSNEDGVFVYLLYVLGAVGICLLAILSGCFSGKFIYTLRQNNIKGLDMDLTVMKMSFRFRYTTLKKATEGFSEAHKIDQGAFGEVFKVSAFLQASSLNSAFHVLYCSLLWFEWGILPDGREMAIKRLFIAGKLRVQEVCNEVDVIGQAQHKNLVRFLGCCFTDEDGFLVYEFLANKSLDLMLFGMLSKITANLNLL
ncbi:unnamed protein product [Ilex paraguariensis]|uniref:Uncharacterized protein n=1 Tax=Ilex paraguariensis TaxID=185542 RepID=A0ABC8SX55_9AQUA